MTIPNSPASAYLVNDPRDSLTEYKGATNAIIETLIDGVRGFETAADVASDELRPTLSQMGTQRRSTTEELIRVSADEDLEPITLDDSGTPTGVLHRTWMSVRETVQGDEGVVAAALNGEQHAKDEIDDLLGREIPESVATIVRRALEEIEVNLEQLASLSK